MTATDIDTSDVIKPALNFEGMDGNACVLLANVRNALRRAGNPPAIVERYTEQAKAGDYDNLLQVSLRYCAEPEGTHPL